MKIIVTGMSVTYPFGGVFWDYIQYVLGFKQLGHEVLYLEDTGKWCYSPRLQTFVEDGRDNAEFFATQLRRLDPELVDAWFFRDVTGKIYGRSWNKVAAFCRDAELFLHISASCWLRDEYFSPRIIAFLDSDPLYTQVSFLGDSPDQVPGERLNWWKRHHDVFFTFGENIHGPDCKVPHASIDWIPTRQPVVLDCFTKAIVPAQARRRVLTTVASWNPKETGPVVDGISYGGKGTEFKRFIDLPSHSPLPLELALSGSYPADKLRQHGWRLLDAYAISSDPWIYRDYLARSFGEWSVAKQAYVASRSGWFSCRSACYLALGVPVIVQDTGFNQLIPTGEGVLTFSTVEEAAAGIQAVKADYEYHQRRAREIADSYFSAPVVLGRMLAQIGLG